MRFVDECQSNEQSVKMIAEHLILRGETIRWFRFYYIHFCLDTKTNQKSQG